MIIFPLVRRRCAAAYSVGSREHRSNFVYALLRVRTETVKHLLEFRMDHSRTDVGPAVRLQLRRDKFFTFGFRQPSTNRGFERFQVEQRLLL
jgi:hypothetical protein